MIIHSRRTAIANSVIDEANILVNEPVEIEEAPVTITKKKKQPKFLEDISEDEE